MCLVLNKSDINPYIYELKRFMNKLMFPKVSEIVLIQFRDLFVSLNDPVCHSQKTLISGEVSSCVGASPNKRKCPNPHSLSDWQYDQTSPHSWPFEMEKDSAQQLGHRRLPASWNLQYDCSDQIRPGLTYEPSNAQCYMLLIQARLKQQQHSAAERERERDSLLSIEGHNREQWI